MTIELRQQLAKLSFEENLRRFDQLIRLAESLTCRPAIAGHRVEVTANATKALRQLRVLTSLCNRLERTVAGS